MLIPHLMQYINIQSYNCGKFENSPITRNNWNKKKEFKTIFKFIYNSHQNNKTFLVALAQPPTILSFTFVAD